MISQDQAFIENLIITSGTLVNANAINMQIGSGGVRQFIGAFDNQGTISIDEPTSFFNQAANAIASNSGTMTVNADTNLFQTGSSTFNSSGMIAIANGRTFTVSSGTFNFTAGTIAGTGTLSIVSAPATFTPDVSNAQ